MYAGIKVYFINSSIQFNPWSFQNRGLQHSLAKIVHSPCSHLHVNNKVISWTLSHDIWLFLFKYLESESILESLEVFICSGNVFSIKKHKSIWLWAIFLGKYFALLFKKIWCSFKRFSYSILLISVHFILLSVSRFFLESPSHL